jgi:hypothetical protein
MTSAAAFAERAPGRGEPGQAARRAAAVARSSGTPLSAGLRADLENRLGHDFRHVRIHADESAAEAAASIGARAFTVGPHVAFGRGEFRPHHSDGRRLLAHELAHVMQQGREPGRAGPPGPAIFAIGPPASARERDASARAAAVMNGVPASGSGLRGPAGPGGTAATVERLQRPGRDQRLDAYLDEHRRLEIMPVGPLDVGRAEPAFRLWPADADAATLAGPGRHGPRHRLQIGELPAPLRGAVQETARGVVPARQVFRVPACADLSVPGAGRFLTFDEYRAAHGADRDMLPLPRALFEVIVARCGRPAEPALDAAGPEQPRPGEIGGPAGRLGVHPDARLAVAETEAEA